MLPYQTSFSPNSRQPDHGGRYALHTQLASGGRAERRLQRFFWSSVVAPGGHTLTHARNPWGVACLLACTSPAAVYAHALSALGPGRVFFAVLQWSWQCSLCLVVLRYPRRAAAAAAAAGGRAACRWAVHGEGEGGRGGVSSRFLDTCWRERVGLQCYPVCLWVAGQAVSAGCN